MSANKLVVCPYDEAHKVKESRLQLHITKCRLNHLNETKFVCPFNATHVFPRQERDYHVLHCIDKAPLDRKLAESLDKNNPFKGRTAVPSYFESVPVEPSGEVWEVDDEGPTSGYVPVKEHPPGTIVEPPPLAKPAVRRQLYKDLHQMSSEITDFRAPQSNSIPPPIPRQPMQLSEAARLQGQTQSSTNHQNLGLGRGKAPASRIAANIFPSSPLSNDSHPSEKSYSSVITSGMGNLGLGRGHVNNAAAPLSHIDDNEFPALGFGRGVNRVPSKQGVKAPRW